MRAAVVISTWPGNPQSYLVELCHSLSQYAAGADYDLILSANGFDYEPPPDVVPLFKEIFIRKNVGYNLGAWHHAWQRLPDHARFLFLQDDCTVLQPLWLKSFIQRFDSTPRCGLVGETLQKGWGKPWSQLCSPEPMDRKDRDPARRAAGACFMRHKLAQWGIPEGETALHVTTVVQFTSREVLEKVNGYNLGLTKEEAIAAEIGFSRKIASHGYQLVQVGRRRHSVIGHRQWPLNTFFARLKRSIRKRLPHAYRTFFAT